MISEISITVRSRAARKRQVLLGTSYRLLTSPVWKGGFLQSIRVTFPALTVSRLRRTEATTVDSFPGTRTVLPL